MFERFFKSKPAIIGILIFTLVISASLSVIKYREYADASREIQGKVDIGGYRLYANCIGKGKPTVIFESGYSSDSHSWEYVQSEISKITKTFSYDRAGLGQSDISPLQWTSANEVRELHLLLERTKIKGPYIIVAHSIGGFNARLFADAYPNEVAGIVFVDSTHESYGERIKDSQMESAAVVKKYWITSAAQVKEARKKDALRNVPIIVLTADHKDSSYVTEEIKEAMIDFHKDIASLSNKSEHIFVNDTGHYIQSDQPEVVIAAIKKLVDLRRSEE